MADFDTKVLYLETPPLSAPKTSYTIGVRIKNQGIGAVASSGYVQVFDKDTGLLVKTYSVESAVIAPDEEKQAFATEVWDLTDAEVGKQFILSGMVTSPGDTVPANDILNPTTVTVIAGEPPDPPAVTPHKSQHEDGGSDELNVEGLFGQLHDPQELADHAATHEAAGGDELNVGGLRGELADRQDPKVHNNDEHSADYATIGEASSLVTQHNGMLTAHEDTESLEHTFFKYAANGYAGLDVNGLIPPAELSLDPPGGGLFLSGTQKWSDPVALLGLELTANKSQANGYPSLDAGALVPTAELGIGAATQYTVLHGDQVYRAAYIATGPPVELLHGLAPFIGSEGLAARHDHQHGKRGSMGSSYTPVIVAGVPVLMLAVDHEAEFVGPSEVPLLEFDVMCDLSECAPGDTVDVTMYYNDLAGGQGPLRAQCSMACPTPAERYTFHTLLRVFADGSATIGQVDGKLHNATGGPGASLTHHMPPAFGTPPMDPTLACRFQCLLQVTGAAIQAEHVTVKAHMDWSDVIV